MNQKEIKIKFDSSLYGILVIISIFMIIGFSKANNATQTIAIVALTASYVILSIIDTIADIKQANLKTKLKLSEKENEFLKEQIENMK